MNIAGIGNTGTDYSRLSTRQVEQQEAQQEAIEDVAKAAESVGENGQPAGSNNEYTSESFSAAQLQAYSTGSELQQASEAMRDVTSDAASGNTTLTNKARSGAELTQSEMSQLKELDSALYAQAAKAQRVRAEAREQMKAHPSSSARIAGEAIARTGYGEDSGTATKAVMEEYRSFAAKYDQADFRAI